MAICHVLRDRITKTFAVITSNRAHPQHHYGPPSCRWHQVPTLEDAKTGFCVAESTAILRFIANK